MEYTTTLPDQAPIVITIGNFDGIHKGHQRLLHEVVMLAQCLKCVPVMVTFSPHTLIVVRPDLYIRYLTTLEEKLALTKHYASVAESIVISFTPQVAAMTAEDFMDSLCTRFNVKGLVVGANFSLGHDRKGDVAFLEKYGQEHAIQVQTIALQEAVHMRISSTRIRTLVATGDVTAANDLLGHPVICSGIVRHGDKRGQQLGFPTANLHPDPHKLLPADGVYAGRVHVPNRPESDSYATSTVYNSAVNIGVRPTFNGQERLVEAYLLDANLELYGKLITLEFIARLRDEQRFPGIEALKTQLVSDTQKARQILTTILGE